MSKIFALVKRDASHVFANVISLVVCVGMIVVPCFYAWFNIAGSWDPYGNTKNLKVALANSDAGYTSELIPVNINMGERMVSDLQGSTSIGYIVTTEEEAIEGVKSGEYYAAIVFPEDFTSNMMSVATTASVRPQVRFYQNEKQNAIAAIVTNKASTAVQQDIDESFAKSVTTVGAGVLSEFSDYLTDENLSGFTSKLDTALDESSSLLSTTSQTLRTFSALASSAQALMDTTSSASSSSLSATLDAGNLLRETAGNVGSLGTAFDGTVSTLNSALSSSSDAIDKVSTQVNAAFDKAAGQTDKMADGLTSAAGVATQAADKLAAFDEKLASAIEKLNDCMAKLEEGTTPYNVVQDTRDSVAEVQERVQDAESRMRTLAEQLTKSATDLAQGATDAQSARETIARVISDAKGSLAAAQNDYDASVKGSLSSLSGSINEAATKADEIASRLSGTLDTVKSTSGNAVESLALAKARIDETADKIDSAVTKMADLKGSLSEALESGDMNKIRTILTEGPDALAAFISSPVEMDRNPIYAIENNGSAMAPFYTTLAIWIGGVVLAALVRCNPSEEAVEELGLKPRHGYLGRMVFFVVIGLIQSSVILLGDLYFLGVQCANPGLFLLVGWAASFVFVNIIYALTASFGDVGKAIAVVLMVIQVAGSGGTFPVQMLPDAFQTLYPFLPFVHAENAMRAAMFGLYNGDFWVELATLLAYLVPALLLGLLLRKPVIRLNEWVEHKLESTKVM